MLNIKKFTTLIILITSITSCHQNDNKQSTSNLLTRPTSAQQLSLVNLPTIYHLPDPFHFSNGKAVATLEDWKYRRAEISTQIQTFSLGKKEALPDHLNANLTNNKIFIRVTHEGKSIEFSAEIILPKKGNAPYPAVIGVGGSWLNNDALLDQGIALIKFPNNEIAEQLNSDSRGKGKFYDLYGKDHSAGALIAWAWGISRLIDGLEISAVNKINTKRLGITGCSRNGKGALVAGAFDERLRLTLPQEAGSGGLASWRISDMQLTRGQTVQTLRQIVQENVWFRADFRQFSEAVNKLPYDQHLLAGLIAPRAMLMVDNTSMEWLGNESTYTSAVASREIWKSLGEEDSFGFSQQGGHQHCHLPEDQANEVNYFVQRFLLDQNDKTRFIFRTDGNYKIEVKKWIPWSTPYIN